MANEAFEQIVRDNDVTFDFLHPVGTASMSCRDSKRGVVDPELREGAAGLELSCGCIHLRRSWLTEDVQHSDSFIIDT